MSNVARRQRDQRTGSETEIECDELQFLTEEEEEESDRVGWRRLLKTFPAQPTLAPVAPTFSLDDLAQKKEPSGVDEQTAAAASSTLAGHVMWKLAVRMSSRNESRLLQHITRSIFSHGSTKVCYCDVVILHGSIAILYGIAICMVLQYCMVLLYCMV